MKKNGNGPFTATDGVRTTGKSFGFHDPSASFLPQTAHHISDTSSAWAQPKRVGRQGACAGDRAFKHALLFSFCRWLYSRVNLNEVPLHFRLYAPSRSIEFVHELSPTQFKARVLWQTRNFSTHLDVVRSTKRFMKLSYSVLKYCNVTESCFFFKLGPHKHSCHWHIKCLCGMKTWLHRNARREPARAKLGCFRRTFWRPDV